MLKVNLKLSIFSLVTLFVMHTLAWLVLILLPLIMLLKIAFALLVAMSLYRSCQYASRCSPLSIIEIIHHQKTWWVKTYNGDIQQIRILPNTVVTGLVICLHAKNERNIFLRSLIFSWELNKSDYRSLARSLRIPY
ncbi:MAG: hypothetical protein K0Q57_641 [Gammaproteobacteria bacterium]|jgi:hypothetical protein|nr:hypothetical protein [Gammaproteobacteria bacterium]